MRLIQLGWLLAVVWAIAPACNRPDPIQPTVDGPLYLGEELKIGILVSGEYFQEHYNPNAIIYPVYLLRDRINACGGVNQTPVSIIVREADGTVEAERQEMEALIEDHRIHGIIALVTNHYPHTVKAFAEQFQVPVLFPRANHVEPFAELQPSSIYWGYTSPSAQQKVEALARQIIAQDSPPLFLVTTGGDEGSMWASALAQAYEAQGGQVLNADQPLIWATETDTETDSGTDDDGEVGDGGALNTRNQAIASLNLPLNQSGVAIAVNLNQRAGRDFLDTLQARGWTGDTTPLFWQHQETLDSILERLDAENENQEPANQSPEPPSSNFAGISGVAEVAVGKGFQQFFDIWQSRLGYLPRREATQAWDAAALFVLAAQAADQNSRIGIASELHAVANRPGTETTDVCQGLEQLRNNEPINFEGASGPVDMNRLGEVPGLFDVWQVNENGDIVVIEQLTL